MAICRESSRHTRGGRPLSRPDDERVHSPPPGVSSTVWPGRCGERYPPPHHKRKKSVPWVVGCPRRHQDSLAQSDGCPPGEFTTHPGGWVTPPRTSNRGSHQHRTPGAVLRPAAGRRSVAVCTVSLHCVPVVPCREGSRRQPSVTADIACHVRGGVVIWSSHTVTWGCGSAMSNRTNCLWSAYTADPTRRRCSFGLERPVARRSRDRPVCRGVLPHRPRPCRHTSPDGRLCPDSATLNGARLPTIKLNCSVYHGNATPARRVTVNASIGVRPDSGRVTVCTRQVGRSHLGPLHRGRNTPGATAVVSDDTLCPTPRGSRAEVHRSLGVTLTRMCGGR